MLFIGGFILAIAATKSGLDVLLARVMLRPVSYTHLDVYKRQEQAINGQSDNRVDLRFAHAETVIPFVALMGIGKTDIQICLLYTSRPGVWKYPDWRN